MSYINRTDIPLVATFGEEPQAVFELDNGDLIAVKFNAVSTAQNTLSCNMKAWLVDADGDAQQLAGTGREIVTEFTHNASPAQIMGMGLQGVAVAMRDLLLGEMPGETPSIPWGDQLRQEVSIRNSIAMAQAMGEVVDLTIDVTG